MKRDTNDPYVSPNRLVYVDKYRNVGHEGVWMDQMVRDKIGKNNAWPVCRSWTDHAAKKFCFECMKNAHDTVLKEVTFDGALDVLGWKKLEFDKDMVHVKFETVKYSPNIDPANPSGPLVPDENGRLWHAA